MNFFSPVNIVQFIGGLLVVTGLIPQITKTYRTKSVQDLSLVCFVAMFLGELCQEIYSISLFCGGAGHAWLITHTALLAAVFVLAALIFRYRHNKGDCEERRNT